MSESDAEAQEFSSAAERDLHGKLEVVRDDPPEAPKDLERRVNRTLRWQRLVVLPLSAAMAFAGGLLGGVRSLAGRGGARR